MPVQFPTKLVTQLSLPGVINLLLHTRGSLDMIEMVGLKIFPLFSQVDITTHVDIL